MVASDTRAVSVALAAAMARAITFLLVALALPNSGPDGHDNQLLNVTLAAPSE